MDERKGKMVVLTEVPSGRGDTWPAAGLESLLASYKVQIANERVMTLPTIIGGSIRLNNPDATLATIPDELARSKNPIGAAFKDSYFQLLYPRLVRPVDAGGPAGNPMLRAEPLLETLQGLPVFTENSLAVKASDLVALMRGNPQEARKRLSPTPLPLGVMVTESSGPPSMGGAPPQAKPRLVVFGNASFVSNQRVSENSPEENFDFFVGTLDWLRERPAGIGIEPRTFKNYMLDHSVNQTRLLLLPALLAVIGIVGLGAGVWVVRRR
jgi:hypothetical protein